jgi:hypothetical protein
MARAIGPLVEQQEMRVLAWWWLSSAMHLLVQLTADHKMECNWEFLSGKFEVNTQRSILFQSAFRLLNWLAVAKCDLCFELLAGR